MKNTDKLKDKGKILYLDDDFGISFQDINGLAMCHCEVNKWSPDIARRCRMQIDKLQREYQRDAYGVARRDDLKHHKFLKRMGFQFFRNKWILDEDNNDLIIQIWEKKNDLNR